MKATRKRMVSLSLVFALLMSLIPQTIILSYAAESKQATISVENVYAMPGEKVTADVVLTGNPGILGANLKLSFDDGLKLVEVTSGDALSALTFTKPGKLQSPCAFVWDAQELDDEDIKDGVILSLTFEVSDSANTSQKLSVNVSCSTGDVVDESMTPIQVTTVNGGISIIDYKPGDLNSDGSVLISDVVMFRRHLAGGYDISINELAANVNGDASVSVADLLTLRRYLAGGYGVKLQPALIPCNHSLSEKRAVEATCLEPGNIAYWYCEKCNMYFNDADATSEITVASTVIAAKGHTIVIDKAVPATPTSTGLTEGSHCSVCHTVIVAQQEIPMLDVDEYSIEYYFSESDPYLQKLVSEGKLVNDNPRKYTAQDNIALKNLSVPGYVFEGWYDGQGSNATQIKTISNRTGSLQLYAHWSKITYTVTFDSPDIPVDSITYTVDTGATFKKPSHFGYTFVGWSKDGKILSSIPVGTIGNITLHANWTSDRNKAVAVSKLDKPIVIEDMDNGQYLFVYEIGTIQNVPLAEIKNLGNTEGISLEQSYTYTQTVNESFAKTITETVSNATTTTSSWTLSEDWNDVSSATNEHEEEKGKTEQTTDSQGNVVEGKYYISNVEGGSTTTTSSAGGSSGTSSKVTKGDSVGINGSYTVENSDSYNVESSVETTIGVSASASVQAGPAAARVTAGVEVSASGTVGGTTGVSSTDMNSRTTASSRSGSFTDEKNQTNESHWDTSDSSSSSWNSTKSYETASSTSANTEISNAISERIYDKYGYSSTIERGGGNSTTKSSDDTTEETNEYATTVEYSVGEEKSYSETVIRQSSATGYYRLVSAGTVHVFAVVGYDIATNSYYTYTYNVLDTERHVYLDYSKDNANFNDCENAILPFEVPYEIHEFVSGVISRSEDLVINENTGIITGYEGDAAYVVIPEYVSVTDGVSRPYAVRVRGISSDAFAGNTMIKGVYLPKYVSEIPNGAFEGCSALEVVMGYGVSEIGRDAFKGCISMNTFAVDEYVTTLGERAFELVPEIEVLAENESIADAAISSGAERITLDITELAAFDDRTVSIPESTEYFALAGKSGEGIKYKNLNIESNAKETFISNMSFVENTATPLKLASEKVTLSKVLVERAPGLALVLTADKTALMLYGTVYLNSSNENAVISKQVSLAKSNPGVAGEMKLTGNYLVCGNITDAGMLSFTSGKVVELTEEEYEAMLTSSIVAFDPNGGVVEETEKLVYYGQRYGELPIPTRSGYAFNGWYTKPAGGSNVTADTVANTLANHTLYAQWIAKAYNVNWSTGIGYAVSVSRISSPHANATLEELTNGAVVYEGDVLSVTYVADTGYTISGNGSSSIVVAGNVTSADIYATATVNSYTASWDSDVGYTVVVERIDSPNAGASTDALSSGAQVYYGDVLSITYTASNGYTIVDQGNSIIDVTGNVTSSDIYATATLSAYSAVWENGIGYSIVVTRTGSPIAGASTGALNSGATVYYGDVLSIAYSANSGYTMKSHGATSITVAGNVTANEIYAKVAQNSYVWGEWSGWSDTPVTGSDTRQVETRQVETAAAYTEYRYGRWHSTSTGWNHFCKELGESQGRGSSWTKQYTSWSKTRHSPASSDWVCAHSNHDHFGYYSKSGTQYLWKDFKINGTGYYWEESRTIPAVYKTQYRYRDLIEIPG